jgi:hypothetical protein
MKTELLLILLKLFYLIKREPLTLVVLAAALLTHGERIGLGHLSILKIKENNTIHL